MAFTAGTPHMHSHLIPPPPSSLTPLLRLCHPQAIIKQDEQSFSLITLPKAQPKWVTLGGTARFAFKDLRLSAVKKGTGLTFGLALKMDLCIDDCTASNEQKKLLKFSGKITARKGRGAGTVVSLDYLKMGGHYEIPDTTLSFGYLNLNGQATLGKGKPKLDNFAAGGLLCIGKGCSCSDGFWATAAGKDNGERLTKGVTKEWTPSNDEVRKREIHARVSKKKQAQLRL